MNLYVMLTKLVDNSTMGITDKQAAREVIRTLQRVNAFGTVVAGAESETDEVPHVHTPETEWYKYDPNKLVDICTGCEEIVKRPYDPTWERKRW